MTNRDDGGRPARDISVGDPGPEVVVDSLERRDFVKYAGASGDFNPLHYDEPYARTAGNESVFGQGMLAAGFASSIVSDWFGLAAIRLFRVRFQARVWPGETLTVSGTVTSVESIGSDTVVEADVVIVNQDGDSVLVGDVIAHLPARL